MGASGCRGIHSSKKKKFKKKDPELTTAWSAGIFIPKLDNPNDTVRG